MMQVGHFYPYQAPQKALLGEEYTYTFERSSVSFEELRLSYKTFKTSRNIVNQRTNDKQACSSVLSCNHPRLGEGQKAP
jgi:hypothetical protein